MGIFLIIQKKNFEMSNNIITSGVYNNNNMDKFTTNKKPLSNKIMNYNDYELNTLEYKEAFEIDKRTFCEFYLSILKTNHLLIFTLFRKNDYNSKIIKILIFFISFTLFYD